MIRLDSGAQPGLVHLLLDKPKGNILDSALLAAISHAVADNVDASTRALVFEGAAKHFSFGASVEEHRAAQAADMLAQFHGLFRELGRLAVPTCALVRGMCLGGGMELASWCTWIAAAPGARFGQPEIKLAVFPPMASIVLPWRVGATHALDLCVSGRIVDAAAALEMGLITAVADDPREWWTGFFQEHLADKSSAALRFAERAVRQPLLDALENDLPRLERLYLDELMSSHDANEGIAAFLERRAPIYQHR